MVDAIQKYDVPTPDASIQSVLHALEEWPPDAAEAAEAARAALAFAVAPYSWIDTNGIPNYAKLRTALSAAEKSSRAALQKVLDADLCNATTDSRTLKFPILLLLATVQFCAAAALTTFKTPRKNKSDTPHEKAQISPPELVTSCQTLLEAEMIFSIGAPPMRVGDPFVEAFSRWVGHAFSTSLKIYEIATATTAWRSATITAFDAYFWGDSQVGTALRDFLIVGDAKEAEPLHNIGTLRTLETALARWIEVTNATSRERQEAWKRHISQTMALPDGQGTMFNESFGVRKVFQPPLVRYHVNGRRSAAKAETIADIGGLFGGLVSNRVSSQDLVVVSGGPGSGKSTLCRVLASRMAAMPGLHPVFLKLRKAKDGSDIMLFVEESLKEKGLIDRMADLWSIPNLVLILDGFDELAMSSRSRLRRFFNILREELREGPLGHARVIVSGRDTLFPGGEGLPSGSHIVALQPFDHARVAAWGAMWRRQCSGGSGHTFHPEKLMVEKGSQSSIEHPLTHLVRWPLTLHLIAQIHTAGRLTVSGDQAIEKAYLYRSILKETAARQEEQTDGEGRMDAARLREFLRTLAWEMYLRQTDSMDPVDVEPLLQQLYRDKPEADRAELAEVAVVNAPELTKGDETGFEFVHKSFSEFLVAEHLAALVERVIQKVGEWDTQELTWRIDETAAADLLAPALAIRPLPQEVQEMLEPMLGVLVAFSRGAEVGDDVDPGKRRDGLLRIIDRFERLYAIYVNGNALDTITLRGREHNPPINPLEAYAHYGLGIVLIGAASARRLKLSSDGQVSRYFQLENNVGTLTRYLCILQAGGIGLERSTASRLFAGSTVSNQAEPKMLNEGSFPAITRYFRPLDGYFARIPRIAHAAILEHISIMVQSVVNSALAETAGIHPTRQEERYRYVRRRDALSELLAVLEKIGLNDHIEYRDLMYITRELDDLQRRFTHDLEFGPELLMRLRHMLERVADPELRYELSHVIDDALHRIDYVDRRRKLMRSRSEPKL